MSVFKSQFSRALPVIKSDNANVPYPAVAVSGTNTSTAASSLIDSTAEFVTNKIAPGDIVYNTTDSTAATVLGVTNETTIVLNASIFAATAKAYVIYQASSQTTIGNYGCILYVGGAGNVAVTTIGGDIVTFSGVPAGTIIPVQVIKVASATTATLINALW
jgi:hypothetical protein